LRNRPLHSSESQLPNNQDEGIPSKENIAAPKKIKYYSTDIKHTDEEFRKNLETSKSLESHLGEASFQAAKEAVKQQQKRNSQGDDYQKEIKAFTDKVNKEAKEKNPESEWKHSDIIQAFNHNDIFHDPYHKNNLEQTIGPESFEEHQKAFDSLKNKLNENDVDSRRNSTETFDKASQKSNELEAFTRSDVERHSTESQLPDEHPIKKSQLELIETPTGHWQIRDSKTEKRITDRDFETKEEAQSILDNYKPNPSSFISNKLEASHAKLYAAAKEAKDFPDYINKVLKNNAKAQERGANKGDFTRNSTESQLPEPELKADEFPVSSENYKENKIRSYGHWINPQGEMLRVDRYGHEKTAIQILKNLVKEGKMTQAEYNKLNIPLNSTTEVENALLSRGWARGVHSGGQDYFANAKKSLTPKQLDALKNYGIERDTNVTGLGSENQTKGKFDIHTKPEDENKLSTESQLPEPEHSSYGFFHAITAQNDKVRKIPGAQDVAKALDEAWLSNDMKRAEYVHVPLKDIGDMNASKEDRDAALKYVTDKGRGKDTPELNPEAQGVADYIQSLWRKVGEQLKAAKLPVRTAYGDLRERMLGEYYGPEMLSDVNKEILTKQAGSPEAKAILDEWANHIVEESEGKVSKEEAIKNLKEYASALGNRNVHDIEFGAVRKARGYGVPENLRETDLLKVLTQYGTRVAKDYSHWTKLQSNPEIAAKLALPQIEGGKSRMEGVDDLMAHPDVKNALRFWMGDFVSQNTPRATAFVRTFLGNLLQTGTQVRNTVQLPGLISPYLSTYKDAMALFKSFGNMKDAFRKSLEYGARSGTMDFDRYHTLESPDRIATGLNKISEVLRKFTGRDLMENSDRAYTFEVGRQIGKGKIVDAINGDEKAQAWLDKFGLGIDTKNLDKLGEHEINVIGKNFVDRVQGTYDARGLPIGAFDSQFAPFFALSRWGIEKSNVIWKDVLNPAIKGENYLPLITYSLGTLMTGAAIRKLNELMSGKKDYTPSVDEAMSADRKDYLLAAFVNLMQQGSYAGIVSDSAKTLSDIFIQHEYPKGPISFPAADFLTQTLGQNLADYTSAIENGGEPLETTMNLLGNIAKSSVQNYRLVNSRILNAEDTERSNKFRDVRTFKKLEGEDVPALSSFHGNQLENKDVQEFKRTGDIGEAASLLPNLVSKALEKSKGDPYKLKQELSKIKENNYQTMPNMQSAPLEFLRYMSYLNKTQGSEEASSRLSDFLLQNAKNQAKSQMVP
jgi:hypothetical protein